MRALAMVGLLLLAGCVSLGAPPEDPRAGRHAGALVVSSNPLAAEAGAAVLRAGGNAVDAAAAVQWALTVVEPHFSGIGGGAFVMHYDAATRAVTVLDGRETSPAASTRDQFMLPGGAAPQPMDVAHTRGYAVGVPGTVEVWSAAVERLGALPLAASFAPAIALAEEGFPVDAYLARYLTDEANAQKLKSWPASARLFYVDVVCPPDGPAGIVSPTGCVGGTPLAEGATFVNPDLARTLRLLQSQGPRGFYEGEVAAAIVGAVQQRQGRMTLADLANYEVVEREPLRGSYRGHEVVTMPAPGGGPVMLQTLALLEGFDLGASGHNHVDTLHLVIEAMRLSYADRAVHLGDPDVVDVPQAGLLHPEYVAARRALIDATRAQAHAAGDPWAYENRTSPAREAHPNAHDEFHTSHLIVVDFDGNVVTSTTTIEAAFGTGMIVPGHGFLLNNELTDFDFRPGGPNEVGPTKRPRSSMSPTLVMRDGEPVLVVGASGGARIIAGVFQTTMNVLDHELSVQNAVAAPRVFAPAFPDVAWDRDLPRETRDALALRGHRVAAEPLAGIAQLEAAVLVDGAWAGAADTRSAAGGVVVLEPVSRERQTNS